VFSAVEIFSLSKENQGGGSGSVSALILVARSGSGSRRAKMTHKYRKSKKNHVLKCWMFSFEG
jgi:hypothetical protein